jgi:hypothetical protein
MSGFLTQDELKRLYTYNPETGEFIRNLQRGKYMPGEIANHTNHHGYIIIGHRQKKYQAHRLAWLYMTGGWPDGEIDHINHIRTDNRWCNLRVVTNQQNRKNASIPKDNKSGAIGVIWHKANKKWLAYIRVNKKQICLGYYRSKESAKKARRIAEKQYGFHENHGGRR